MIPTIYEKKEKSYIILDVPTGSLISNAFVAALELSFATGKEVRFTVSNVDVVLSPRSTDGLSTQ